jgi:DHA3 family tetracycline resistance protein-like MFS transporter
MSFVGIAFVLPQVLLLLVGGVLSDRFERRRLMMASDVLRALSIGAMGLLTVTGNLRLWELVALVVVYGIGDALFAPAFGAIVPEIVPPDLLLQANSLDQFVRPAVRLLGPALGGGLVAGVGAGWAFLGDAATFGCSTAALLLMARRPHPAEQERRSVGREIVEGYRYARSKTWLWGTLLVASVGNVGGAATYVLVPYVVKNVMHSSAGVLGLVFSTGAVGALLASLALGQLGLPRRHIVLMLGSWGIGGYLVLGWALAQAPWQGMLVAFGVGAAMTLGQVVWGTLMHTLVPRELLGRVTSFDWMISISLMPAFYALVGPLAQAVGVRAAFVVAGLLAGTSPFAFLLLLPGIRATEQDGTIPSRAETAPVA